MRRHISASSVAQSVLCAVYASLCLFFGLMQCSDSREKAPAMKIGLGETVITPRENVKMSGFARSQVSNGVHDNLHARSLVLEDRSGTAVLLMSLSLSGLSSEIDSRIRAGIANLTGIPHNNIIITCTHTHSGPSVEQAGESYISDLIGNSIESAVAAWNSRFPARIGTGSTEVFELGHNRRRLLYGGLHPDPEVGILKIEDSGGKVKGILFNYGCHPSALDWQNRLFSEDWPCYAIEGIKKIIGEDVWVAYFQSAPGDINIGYSAELSAVGAEMPIRNYWYIEKKGSQMAEAVVRALQSIKVTKSPELSIVSGTFDYPLRESLPVTLEAARHEAEMARKALDEIEKIPELEKTRRADEARMKVFLTGLRARTAEGFYGETNRQTTAKITQQAVRIGDAVFLLVPGELFSEIGLKIKERSPFNKTFILGLMSGHGGYLPTEKEFIEGDYEVDGSRYSARTERVCIESSLTLINRLLGTK